MNRGATERLETASGGVAYYPLAPVADESRLSALPFVVRVFLENALRHQGRGADATHLANLRDWPSGAPLEVPFFPARVVLQDLTGVPCVADLAALRDAVARLGGDPRKVNPKIR